MRTSDFDYHLPPKLIAQTPLEPRDSSKLLVLHRAAGQIDHRDFVDIAKYVHSGDVMVFNQSRVIPARLYGRREDTGGKVELLLLRRIDPETWQALGQPGPPAQAGREDNCGSERDLSPISSLPGGHQGGFTTGPRASAILGGGDTGFPCRWNQNGALGLRTGYRPPGPDATPPYIHQRLEDPERYQTVYAGEPGSVAAPTAGLHFTQELMETLKGLGVELAFVTLHVGLDTFRRSRVRTPQPTRYTPNTSNWGRKPPKC